MEFVQVVSVENMRKSDARTIAEHTPSAELMYRAAQGIFNSAKFVGRVAIVCGKGNNGGDGFAAARLLLDREYRVTVALIGCDKPKTEDALAMYNAYVNAGGAVISDPYNADKAEVVIDELFGTGMKKPLA